MADSRGHSNGPAQGSLLEQQTGEAAARHSKTTSALWLVWSQVQKTGSPIRHKFRLTAIHTHTRLLSQFKLNTNRGIKSYELCFIEPDHLSLLTAPLSSMTMSGAQGSMLHLQGNMQHSPLGISIINAHSGSVSFKTRQGEGNLLSRPSSDHLTVKYHWICFSDVSVLHKRVALSGVPVSHHSLPADTPAGVLAHPNWTTGTGRPCHESLVFKGRNYKLFGNSRKKTPSSCVYALS